MLYFKIFVGWRVIFDNKYAVIILCTLIIMAAIDEQLCLMVFKRFKKLTNMSKLSRPLHTTEEKYKLSNYSFIHSLTNIYSLFYLCDKSGFNDIDRNHETYGSCSGGSAQPEIPFGIRWSVGHVLIKPFHLLKKHPSQSACDSQIEQSRDIAIRR